MIKYPHIEQFRQIVKKVKENHDFKGYNEDGSVITSHTSPYPILKFNGTIKLHGTNSSIVKYKDRIAFQSRNRELSISDDNAGYVAFMSTKNINELFNNIEFNDSIVIYGEWCGGNIQKGIALNNLPKMFVIFGVLVDGKWKDYSIKSSDDGIYNISQFKQYEIDIDFNHPELIQNDLIRMTLEVEEKCPVASYFGVDGVGEGIVFTSVDDPNLKFKSKGEKHSISKVKTLNIVDNELLEDINNFIDSVLTENRLRQGIEFLKEMGKKITQENTGDYIRWIVNDITREEEDIILTKDYDKKKLNTTISKKAKEWYFNNL